MAAVLVLEPIFEADLQPEQYAYRSDRSALDAVRHVHRLINTGHGEIVDADLSGYFDSLPHSELLKSDGRVLPWAKAMALFKDTTGRPGPATWALGEYPSGQDDFPVSGVSWYEAAAYAKFVGKALPTIYHWKVAASRSASAIILPASNFSMEGLAKVGTYQGMSQFGAYDMAGNVKEWICNQDSSGKRYVLGGAWNEPAYMFVNVDARSPFDRMANIGFRCAAYSLSGEYAKVADVIDRENRDYRVEKPVSEVVYQAYKHLYTYEKTPLNAIVESSEQTEDWKKEKITFAAAYGKERIIAYLYLPKKSSPPFQTVVYFPGASAIVQESSDNNPQLNYFDFVIKSGRAVLFPVYKGTYERADGYQWGRKDTSNFRDHMVAWVKDFSRSIDYLETRPDIDAGKLAYSGESLGAALGAIVPAVETRLKVLVLNCPGFYMQKIFPEADPFNFAPRVTAPVLMLNGRYDFIYPPDTSQVPMFQLLGTPKQDKRRLVYDTAHDIPRAELVKETLNWLDRYLGPVNRSAPWFPYAPWRHCRSIR
jgi:cephalosporin-C deacetylase-like acetyl esterase